MKLYVTASRRKTTNKKFLDAAHYTAKLIQNTDSDLIFCGATSGLIGEVFRFTTNSRHIAVTSNEKEAEDLNTENFELVYQFDTLNEKKDALINLADAFIFLPGGFDVVDELISIFRSKTAREHNKKIIIYNVDGYYTTIIDSLIHTCISGFSDFSDLDLIDVCLNITDVAKALFE